MKQSEPTEGWKIAIGISLILGIGLFVVFAIETIIEYNEKEDIDPHFDPHTDSTSFLSLNSSWLSEKITADYTMDCSLPEVSKLQIRLVFGGLESEQEEISWVEFCRRVHKSTRR